MGKKIAFLLLILVSSLSFAQKNRSGNEITKIILVRHAEKLNDGSKNPSLSEIGKIRAEKLKDMFADVKIDKLFSTPYLRTKETLEPLSINRNLPIIEYNPGDKSFAENLLIYEKGKTIVVVGHSNTCPELVNNLLKMEKFKALTETEYNKIWMLTFKNEELIDCVLLNF
jgi:2,3-bisphosphoglycerate-dependent phosphoglycerate mutase